MIKLIVSDLDGTLLKRFKGLSERNRLALIEAQKKGIKFAIATGRGLDSTHQFIDQLQLKTYGGFMILNNGQRFIDVKDDHEEVLSIITKEDAQRALQIAMDHQLQMVMDGDQGLAFYSPENMRFYRDLYIFLIRLLPHFRLLLSRIHVFALFGFLKSQKVKLLTKVEDITDDYDKIGFTHFKHQLDASMNTLTQAFKGDLEVMRVSDNWLDLSPKGTTKLMGILKLIQQEGIQEDEVLVLGDSENDATMLKYFKNSYAMANASDQIKALANFIAPSNMEDGVAQVIESVVLKSEHKD
jgi:Cof subfamily protein (haloacid dehalogenase superfamily)